MPENIALLHFGEEQLRKRSIGVVEADERLLLHFQITERSMDVLDVFRQMRTDDENVRVVQMLGLRMFNALACATKLTLSGYYLFGAHILRDVIETVFLVDLFRTDRGAITRWRHANDKVSGKEFLPVNVRITLDKRDGFTSKKREELYKLFSALAGHPTMASVAMLRPKGMDAMNGPFVDPNALEANASEMGRLAVQVGEHIIAFASEDRSEFVLQIVEPATTFTECKRRWIAKFYSDAVGE